MQLSIFGDHQKEENELTFEEILDGSPLKPCKGKALLAFSGGNDSRTLAHVVKPWFERHGIGLELAAIDTGLSLDPWKDSVIAFSELIGLPISFWTGEGQKYYRKYVEDFGWPGNAVHSQIQNHLKGRAYRKMVNKNRSATPKQMENVGVAVWILSGVRKKESRKRLRLTSPYSAREGAQFINPLFYWSNAQVIDYMIMYDIPFAPGKQWDCKCGSTAADAEAEWAEIEKNSPNLLKFLLSLDANCSWQWGRFTKGAYKAMKMVEDGQATMWADDGSLESYPTCLNCVNDVLADELSVLEDWE